ncbi:phosphatidate cytidylyltransferase [Lachnospiraceae bacterium C10]|nr:phosphatidate cytidylyltransferase [Lachnospiraceae bacterium C10]
MFKTRLLSGIVLVILALLFIITGGDVLLASTLVISMIGLFEFHRALSLQATPLAYVAYAVTLAYYADLRFHFLPAQILLGIVFMVLLLFIFVFTYPKYKIQQVAETYFGVFYVAVMLSYIYQTREYTMGTYLVWLIFLCSWGCDTCAYCVGRLFGKHKMAPVLSPKKSVEGAIGGVAGAFLLTFIYCLVFRTNMQLSINRIVILSAIASVGSLISMVGDLAASAIKRNVELKDYGHLIPGHGGILDRFDSVIITAPIIYYLITFAVR